MAKIAFIGALAHGHTNPTLPVVRELVANGHQVLYYNAEEFRAKIEPTGVDFRPYPEPLPTSREVAQRLTKMINASLLIADISEHLTPFVLREMEREQPDLIIYDSIAMWGYIAARTHNIPHMCSISHFVLDGLQSYIGLKIFARFLWSAIPHIPRLIGWRIGMARRYGSANVGGITEYADLNLVYTSADFHPDNDFIDERFRFVGAAIDPTTRDGDFPFEQLGDGPVVYISLGTINYLDHDFYRAAFAAFADYPAQFILSVGTHTDISQLGDIPANFIVRHYVPQLEVLQRVDAFITHGGINSVQEGLYYGVPLVVVPHQFEQYVNGKRVAETGAGLMPGKPYPFGRVTAKELRDALDTLLNDPGYQQRAAHYGHTLKVAGGYRQAVAEIERFIGVQQPQVA